MTRIRTLSSICALLLAVAFTSANAQDQRRAFVTSTIGTGDLSSWADAGDQTGLAAADAICQAHAAAGGLANPPNFVAWLSDEEDDAYCRLHGLTGKKADNCGQAELPNTAGPWLRVDGLPFGNSLGEMLAPDFKVLSSLSIDESGQAIIGSGRYFTGTDELGQVRLETPFGTVFGTCNGWTSDTSPPSTTVGDGFAAGQRWTLDTGGSCVSGRLACMETVPGPPLPLRNAPGRPAFVTSATGTGDLSSWAAASGGTVGIAAADSICQNLASAANLDRPDTFKAWLSDTNVNAIDRFEFDGPWVRTDGVPFADNKADLVAAFRRVPLNHTDTGIYLGLGEARTGTGLDGNIDASANVCSDWTSSDAAVFGRTGRVEQSGASWTSALNRECSFSLYRLYCLADFEFIPPVDEIFVDRFEPPPPVTQTIGAGGGEIETSSGAFRVELPPGAVDEPTEFQLFSLGSTPDAPYGRFRLEPSPINFEQPVLLEFRGSDLPEPVLMARFADGEILPLRTSQQTGDTVRAATRTFSEFGLVDADPDCTGLTCPEGNVCFDGACIQPCATVECADNDYQCLWEECPGSTCQDVVCPEGTTCECGICMEDDPGPQGCGSDADCAGDDLCLLNTCEGVNQCVDGELFDASGTSYDSNLGRMNGTWVGYVGNSCFNRFMTPLIELNLDHAPGVSTVTGTATEFSVTGGETVGLNASSWNETAQRFTTSWDMRINNRNENFQLTDCTPVPFNFNPLHELRCDYNSTLIGAAIRIHLRRK